MSYLANIYEKQLPFFDGEPKMTALEYAIWFASEGTNAVDMEAAAAELAAKDAEIERLQRIEKAAKAVSDNLSKTEIIDIDGKEYNVWGIVGDAEQDELAAALQEAK